MKTLSIPAIFLLLVLPLQAFANCCLPANGHMHHEGAATPVTVSCAMTASPEVGVFDKTTASPEAVPLPSIIERMDIPPVTVYNTPLTQAYITFAAGCPSPLRI